MSTSSEYLIHIDGASRGNPGPAAFAYVIEGPDQAAIEEKGHLGETTNNIAEYTALVRALEHAKSLGARRLLIHSDSELLVKQMNGAYKVKHPGLLPLYQKADRLRGEFDEVTLRHVRREHNKRADRLCNEALDAAAGRPGPKATPTHPAPAARMSAAGKRHGAEADVSEASNRRDLERLVRDDALTCIRASAAAWARDKNVELQPEHVWEQIWSILVEAGILRKRR